MAVEEKPRDLNEFCKKIAATARLRRGDGREDDIAVLCFSLPDDDGGGRPGLVQLQLAGVQVDAGAVHGGKALIA